MQVPEGAIHCLHDVAMLHGSLIPNDQVSLGNQPCQLGVLGNITKGGLITGNRDLKAGVCSVTTLKEKSSNARGCNTEDNLVL